MMYVNNLSRCGMVNNASSFCDNLACHVADIHSLLAFRLHGAISYQKKRLQIATAS
jgi:hypothetical protein